MTWASTRLPDLPGPGVYEVDPATARRVSIRQSTFECLLAGTLRVDQLAYSDDFRPIATLSRIRDAIRAGK